MNSPSGEEHTDDSTSLKSEEFVEKLRRALRRDGDFPASARVVSQLKELVSNPSTTANQITELILREPSLGTRVLHLVNSTFYRRSKPIMTVSQAVVQIGMRPLAELCSGLVLLQKFIPAARKDGVFAEVLQKTITTSLLTSTISSQMKSKGKQNKDEEGYLAGTFYELGTLLLAFYFPKIYQSALKRSVQKSQHISQSIREITGLSPVELSLEVIGELKLPTFYQDVLSAADSQNRDESGKEQSSEGSTSVMADSLFAAHTISEVIISKGSKEDLQQALIDIHDKIELESVLLSDVVGNLAKTFRNHCDSLDLPLPDLPQYIQTYAGGEPEEYLDDEDDDTIDEGSYFAQYVEEIRVAVENREPTASVITTVMETFAWSLGFDRVLLLLVNQGKKRLVGRMLLGNVPDFDPKTFVRPIGDQADSYAPDAKALAEGRPVFQGDPIFEGGWPMTAIPIGFGSKVIGVIYADRTNGDEEELTGREQAAIGVLAELLDRSISLNS